MESLLECCQIMGNPTLHIAGDSGGDSAFIFPDHRPDIRRKRDFHAVISFVDDRANLALMCRICIAMEQCNDDCICTITAGSPDRLFHAGAVQRCIYAAILEQSFGYAINPFSGHQWRWPAREDIVGIWHFQTCQFKHILKSCSDDQCQWCTATLDDGIDADSRAMTEPCDGSGFYVFAGGKFLQAGNDLRSWFVWCGKYLEGFYPAGFIIKNTEIGKGSTDINRHSIGHYTALPAAMF